MAKSTSGKQKVSCPVDGCAYRGTKRGLRMHLRYHTEEERMQAEGLVAKPRVNGTGSNGTSVAHVPTVDTTPVVEPTPPPPAKPRRDLRAAFHSECVDLCMYQAFAQQASSEGHHGIAKLFRAASAMEQVHVRRMIGSLGATDQTLENLNTAFESETDDVQRVLPEFQQEAARVGNTAAEQLFGQIIRAETAVRNLFGHALRRLKSGRDIPLESYYVCNCCGTPQLGVPSGCPVCGSSYRSVKPVA